MVPDDLDLYFFSSSKIETLEFSVKDKNEYYSYVVVVVVVIIRVLWACKKWAFECVKK